MHSALTKFADSACYDNGECQRVLLGISLLAIKKAGYEHLEAV